MNLKKPRIALGVMAIMLAVLDTQPSLGKKTEKIRLLCAEDSDSEELYEQQAAAAAALRVLQRNNLEVWLNGPDGVNLFSRLLNEDGSEFLDAAVEVIYTEFLIHNYFTITSLSNTDIMGALENRLNFIKNVCGAHIKFSAIINFKAFLKEDGTIVDDEALTEILKDRVILARYFNDNDDFFGTNQQNVKLKWVDEQNVLKETLDLL